MGAVEKRRIVEKMVVRVMCGLGVDESVVGVKGGLVHLFVRFIILSINPLKQKRSSAFYFIDTVLIIFILG